MNLSSILPLIMILFALIGAAVSWWLGGTWYLGASIGLAAVFAPLVLLGITVKLFTLWRPDLPKCACGRCDYDFVPTDKAIPEAQNTKEYHYCCRHCGAVYVMSDNNLSLIDEQGDRRTYMTHTKWGRWRRAD